MPYIIETEAQMIKHWNLTYLIPVVKKETSVNNLTWKLIKQKYMTSMWASNTLHKIRSKQFFPGAWGNQLTQAKGLRHSSDIRSHLLCFDHTAGQRECKPFWKWKKQSKSERIKLPNAEKYKDAFYDRKQATITNWAKEQ